jgi:hypothetical protein
MTRLQEHALLLLAATLMVLGCGQQGPTGPKPAGQDKGPVVKKDDDKNKHEGWWCDEHGIPEDECSMCSAKVAKECKAKGDWCKEHDRAMSQCFYCKPDRREFYAAKYFAKFGKEPPPIDEFDKKKDGQDKK